MVAANAEGVKYQGKGTLHFEASVGDLVRVFGLSGSGNFDDGVLVHQLKRVRGTEVFGTWRSSGPFQRKVVVPYSEGRPLPPSGKSPRTEEHHFWLFSADIRRTGEESYNLHFALYERKHHGLELYGYFYWDPTIKVRD